jgi:sugar phosphate isomerase/epimerase
MNRRLFLEKMAAVSAATMVSSNLSWAAMEDHRIEKVGIQLYTVRKALAQDMDGTLAKVAAIGYREVEGPLLKLSAADTKATLDRHGLVCPSIHRNYDQMGDKWPKVLDFCHTIGAKYVVISWIEDSVRNGPDGFKHAAEDFNRAGEASKKAGIQFAFHNHWIDFTRTPDGKIGYDVLLENSDPDLVKMELDICWSTVGGIDPVEYFAKYPGRFPLVHVKDLKKIPSPTVIQGSKITGDDVVPLMTEAGSGVIDWKRIFAHAKQGGIKHYFVEHDEPADPIASARASYEYLAKLRF